MAKNENIVKLFSLFFLRGGGKRGAMTEPSTLLPFYELGGGWDELGMGMKKFDDKFCILNANSLQTEVKQKPLI